jgi:hypothetical protein
MKTITIAKRYIKETDDGEPLPGSVEEDLAQNPDDYFKIKDDRVTSKLHHH